MTHLISSLSLASSSSIQIFLAHLRPGQCPQPRARATCRCPVCTLELDPIDSGSALDGCTLDPGCTLDFGGREVPPAVLSNPSPGAGTGRRDLQTWFGGDATVATRSCNRPWIRAASDGAAWCSDWQLCCAGTVATRFGGDKCYNQHPPVLETTTTSAREPQRPAFRIA